MITYILIFFLVNTAFFVYRRRARLLKELEEKSQAFQEQINIFFNEYNGFQKQYISDSERKVFTSKWENLYSEIRQYKIPQKNPYYESIEKFTHTYKNINKIFDDINNEFQRKTFIKVVSQEVSLCLKDFSDRTSLFASKSTIEEFNFKWAELASKIKNSNIRNNDEEYSDFNKTLYILENINTVFSQANKTFTQNELQKHDSLFSNIDGKSLDQQQREAVINDEDRILLLAGAGSGKTLTIAAKVKYLCETRAVNPADILLISFTKKAAEEMSERIQKILNYPVIATTFHKLGLDIIKQALGKRPDVFEESALSQFVHDFFENKISLHQDIIENLVEYFAYYLEIPNNIDDFDTLGDLYEAEKSADLETLKSKYDQEKYIHEKELEKKQNLTTLNNEKVKSLEEIKIANFLFVNGIKYEYEKLYPYENEDKMRKAYRPDFYLSDYDIYLEHFGINKDGRTPQYTPIEEKKYLEGMQWKREVHQKNQTKLIETYSYYSSEGILLKKLKEILVENGVQFNPRDPLDIFNTVYTSKSNKYFPEFIKLCCTFIALFKSNNYQIPQIDIWLDYAEEKNDFFKRRTCIFLEIIKVILQEYQNHLSENNAIDFADMINLATEKVNNNHSIHPYKYVIVDEYQDVSKSRFDLIKAILKKTNAKFFCVGDDWQSIYRFAGSDISLFTNLEKYLGHTEILRIENTYRNSQNLINEASNFILQNPSQLKKNLRSNKQLDYPLVFWGFTNDPKQALTSSINKIVSEFGTNKSILLLGRTNYDISIAMDTGLFRSVTKNGVKSLEYTPYPDLPIQFLSVHKSKGLEADNVILLNFKNDLLGFPNQIADDQILDYVLMDSEHFKFAEERRLFYVAITRTKNRTFILTDNNKPSPFFKEFNESKSVCFVYTKKREDNKLLSCPLCQTGTLQKIEHEGKFFVGCSNYPRCRFTSNNIEILLAPKRCPACGGFLVSRNKNKFWFYGCTNYPTCVYTEKIDNHNYS